MLHRHDGAIGPSEEPFRQSGEVEHPAIVFPFGKSFTSFLHCREGVIVQEQEMG